MWNMHSKYLRNFLEIMNSNVVTMPVEHARGLIKILGGFMQNWFSNVTGKDSGENEAQDLKDEVEAFLLGVCWMGANCLATECERSSLWKARRHGFVLPAYCITLYLEIA